MKTRKTIIYVLGTALLLLNVMLFFRYRSFNNPNYDIFNLLMYVFLVGSIFVDPLNEHMPKLSRIAMIRLTLLALGTALVGYNIARIAL